jgi:hypothetical protein
MKGHNSVMPTIVRTSNRPYRWNIGMASLDQVASRSPPRAASTSRR